MTIIDTKHAPRRHRPYSQAYETNGLVITSGQLPVNPADGTMPEASPPRPSGAVGMWAPFWSRRLRLRQGGQDHLLPGRHRRLRRLQRGVRQVLHLQARPLLRGSEGSAQGRLCEIEAIAVK